MVLRIAAAVVCSSLGWGQPVVVAFGDSLTAPRKGVVTYSDLLAERLNVKVVNRGVGGNTSEMARARFTKDVLEARPALAIIQLGTNDAAVDVWKPLPASEPRVEVGRYRENLQYFVRALRAAGAKAILMTPNRMAWTPRLKELYGRAPYDTGNDDGFNVLLDLYSDVMRGIAVRERVPLVDAALLVGKEDLLDGMHPSSGGHGKVAEALLPVVRRELGLP